MDIRFLNKQIDNEFVNKDSNADISASFEAIDSQDKVISILYSLMQKHEFLSMTSKLDETQYTSLLLDVNEQQKYIVLDQFYPPPKQQFRFHEQNIEVVTLYRGVEARFVCRLEAVSEEDTQGEYYKASLPEVIYYLQRRMHRRVLVDSKQANKIYLSTDKHLLTHGQLRDISLGGFRAHMISVPSDEIYRGAEISKCLINLDKSNKIYGPVEIIDCEESYKGRLKVACKFLDLNKQEERLIEKWVAQLDRQNRRLLKAV